MAIDDIITSRLSDATNIADTSLQAAKTFVEAFAAIAGATPPITITTDTDASPVVTDDPTGLPSLPDETLLEQASTNTAKIDNDIADHDKGDQQTNENIVGLENTYQSLLDKIPTVVSIAESIYIPQQGDFSFSEDPDAYKDEESPYYIEFHNALKAAIEYRAEVMEQVGSVLSANAEEAKYYENANQKEIDRQMAVDAALRKQCGRGFKMFQGYHFKTIADVNEAFMTDKKKLSREIYEGQMKTAADYRGKTLAQAIEFNAMMIEHMDSVAQRSLTVAKLLMDLMLSGLRFQIETAMRLFEIDNKAYGLFITSKERNLQKIRSMVAIADSQLSALLLAAEAYLEKYRANADKYRADVEVAKATTKINQASDEAQLEIQKANVMAGIAGAQNTLRQYVATKSNALGAGKAEANSYKNIVGGIIESLSTVLRIYEDGETQA